jgi:hypothetical protein
LRPIRDLTKLPTRVSIRSRKNAKAFSGTTRELGEYFASKIMPDIIPLEEAIQGKNAQTLKGL